MMNITTNERGMKTALVVVPEWGARDAGKAFLLTEMPAAQAEKWAYRAFLALKSSDERIPDDTRGLGMVGIAKLGLNVFLRGTPKFEDLEPLLDEMMTCVQAVRDKGHPEVAGPLIEADILEVRTRAWLRGEVLELHTGFSAAEGLSTLLSAGASAETTSTT